MIKTNTSKTRRKTVRDKERELAGWMEGVVRQTRSDSDTLISSYMSALSIENANNNNMCRTGPVLRELSSSDRVQGKAP